MNGLPYAISLLGQCVRTMNPENTLVRSWAGIFPEASLANKIRAAWPPRANFFWNHFVLSPFPEVEAHVQIRIWDREWP